MIHELLLALSGHQTPLFSSSNTPLTSQLSSAELALLKQLEQLGHLHQDVQKLSTAASESHDSTICRAIGASIYNTQLSAFQQKILTIEQTILCRDSSIVGAYDIVPLSSIAKAFVGWSQRLAWLKEACGQMRDEQGVSRSGAHMIDWLRSESRTGFPDLELVILELIDVAEKAWLRQLSAWIFYGRLPTIGAKDFLVQSSDEPQGFRTESQFCPAYVISATARSILFIGKNLNSIKKLDSTSLLTSDRKSILSENVDTISSLRHPIVSANLSQAVEKIRHSLARNVLQNLLPSTEVLRFLNVLQEFFLVGRVEFSIALVGAADHYLRERNFRAQGSRNTPRLADNLIKESDITTVLKTTWASLTAFQDINDDKVDSALEFAREIVHLHIGKRHKPKEDDEVGKLLVTFNDTLLATPVILSVRPSPMLSLFFSEEDNTAYSMIHAYLISIRRIHLHLSDLWKLSVLRRDRFGLGADAIGLGHLADRFWWATLFSAAFFVTELNAHFQGEVIAKSWAMLQQWVCKDDDGERDPETMAAAHSLYLFALREELLLNRSNFVKALRKLMDNCNQMVALVQRIGVVHQSLQAFHDKTKDFKELPSHLVSEHHEVQQDLVLAAQAVNKSLKDLKGQLQEMDTMRPRPDSVSPQTVGKIRDIATSFTPWKGSGIQSLVMKLNPQAVNIN